MGAARRAGGRVTRPAPGPAHRPAAPGRGLTHRQIAERLGIQERSAEGHVERIRLRLGVTSRAQVAAWWAREAAGAEVAE